VIVNVPPTAFKRVVPNCETPLRSQGLPEGAGSRRLHPPDPALAIKCYLPK